MPQVAASKLKPGKATFRDRFAAEYAGIDGSSVYYPKSIEELRGSQLRHALKGMVVAWNIAQSSKGFIPTDTVSAAHQNSEFFEFLLYFWLLKFNRTISAHLLPLFKERSDREMFLKGKVNFCLFEIEDESEFRGFLCNYSDLSLDFPFFRILKDGYREVIARLADGQETFPEVSALAGQGLSLLKRVPTSPSPMENAFKQLNLIDDKGRVTNLPQKVALLSEPVTFFANLIANRYSGASANPSYLPGFLVNLNYLLEFVLRRALRTTYKDLNAQKKAFDDGKINDIYVLKGDGSLSNKYMNPDCVGIFSSMSDRIDDRLKNFFEDKIYIFDAKHKIFSAEDEIESIGRNDFFQIVSYSTTHFNRENRKGVYGLVGLELQETVIEDRQFASREYIATGSNSKCSLIRIETERASVDVVQIPMRFGQFLYDLGLAEDDEHDAIYANLGKNILEAIYLSLVIQPVE
jgi:hypothetical protein